MQCVLLLSLPTWQVWEKKLNSEATFRGLFILWSPKLNWPQGWKSFAGGRQNLNIFASFLEVSDKGQKKRLSLRKNYSSVDNASSPQRKYSPSLDKYSWSSAQSWKKHDAFSPWVHSTLSTLSTLSTVNYILLCTVQWTCPTVQNTRPNFQDRQAVERLSGLPTFHAIPCMCQFWRAWGVMHKRVFLVS